jgi:hypothetical protein
MLMSAKTQRHTRRSKPAPRAAHRRLTFTVVTARPLPLGEQVFVSGNVPALGDWAPDGLPLSRTDENVWTGAAEVPRGLRIEFKITRGSWETEEAGKRPGPPPNHRAPPRDEAAVRLHVKRWRDGA